MKKDSQKTSLTRVELQLMNILWDKGEATVQQLHDMQGESKTAYTTTLSMMQVLTRKGIVTFEKVGKANVYRPLLTRDEYISSFVSEAKAFLPIYDTLSPITMSSTLSRNSCHGGVTMEVSMSPMKSRSSGLSGSAGV